MDAFNWKLFIIKNDIFLVPYAGRNKMSLIRRVIYLTAEYI